MSEPRLEAVGEGSYRVTGELTFASVPALWSRSVPLLAQAAGPVEIDLSGIERADSAGVALLLEWTRTVRAHGPLRLRHLPAQTRELVRVSGLEGVLDCG